MIRAWLSPKLRSTTRWLNRHALAVARALRPAWWALDTRLRLTDYWGQRRHFHYYAEVARLARGHVPAGGSVLEPPSRFDLVLCLQVLEHLQDPAAFAEKLLVSGRLVIISVPHRWPAGLNPGHVQDPVDEAKLSLWAGRAPVETSVVLNGRDRLIAVFRGTLD